MSTYETTIAVKAPVRTTWARISEVCHWPSWMPTVTSIDIEREAQAPRVATERQHGVAQIKSLLPGERNDRRA
jgi:hypothetical protein